MGQLDQTFDASVADTLSFETRELAWELSQERADADRVRYLMEIGADLRAAIFAAKISEKDLQARPTLRALGLARHLHPQQA